MVEQPYEVQFDRGDASWMVCRREGTKIRIHKTYPGQYPQQRERAEEECRKMNAGCALGG